MGHKNKSMRGSFGHAFDGLISALKAERNMKVHAVMTILVVVCAFVFRLTVTEKVIVFAMCGLVITAELFNTALEAVVDICSPEFSTLAKTAKDTAAAAVLVMSITAAVVGTIIFLPYGINLIQQLI